MVPNSRTSTPEDIRAMLKDRDRSGFVIGVGEMSVGIVEVCWEENRIMLDALAILPEYRRKGYGTQIMRRLLDQFLKWDVSEITLIVASANHEAYRLYESMGFEWKETKSVWYVTEDQRRNRLRADQEEMLGALTDEIGKDEKL